MDVIVAIALLAAVLALALTHAFRGQRRHAADQPGQEPAVTLSVLPGRRAVVTVDAKGDRLAGTVEPSHSPTTFASAGLRVRKTWSGRPFSTISR